MHRSLVAAPEFQTFFHSSTFRGESRGQSGCGELRIESPEEASFVGSQLERSSNQRTSCTVLNAAFQ